MSHHVLEIEGLSYTYANAGAPALRDVSLTVDPGEFVVLAGLSASGKSTLLRAASGLVPHFYGGTFGGRVRVGGLDTREHGPADIACVAGTLFQDPETQVVLGTVRSELAFPLENRGLGASAVARGVEEVALALGVENLLDRPTAELSGGELQRVALGASVAGRPDLVLLDEPTSQLDPVAGDELVWLLRRLNEEWGTAVLLCEHRLERCLGHADRVIAMDRGGVACDGDPRAFLRWAGEYAPALQTPGARLFDRAGLRPLPAGVKEARATLRSHGLLAPAMTGAAPAAPHAPEPAPAPRRPKRAIRGAAALLFDRAWFEYPAGRTVLRDVSLAFAPGERVALMGRNGAGKSTLLRHAGGLMEPTRGTVRAAGRVALLLQDPGAYLVHETVAQEAPAAALEAEGLLHLADRNPRDLSGGERQRLALAVVLGSPSPTPNASRVGTAVDVAEAPAVICLDEPTRGMDRGAKGDLVARLRALSGDGGPAAPAVIVATHDAELAAAFADRVILLADGRPIADGPTAEVLAGGWYFATETARILGGSEGALLPEEGAELLRGRMTVEVAP